MRIGIDAIALLSPLTGIGQYTWHLVRELQGLLREAPRLFYGAGWSDELRTQPLPTFAKEAKETVARFIPRPEIVSRFLMQRRFDKEAGALALYHEPNYLAFRFQGPTVVTVHDLSWIRFPELHPKDRVRLMNSTMPRVVREAAHILVDSDFIRGEVIEHYGLAPGKVTTVRLGVTPDFRPRDAGQTHATLSRHGLVHGGYVLAVGTLEPRKNLRFVIESYARLPVFLRSRFPLVVAGAAGWGDQKLPPEVRQLGFLPPDDLVDVYAGARAFVYPSLYEGFGLPPLEAMACGIPTIVSRRASLPELVGDAAILVDPEDSLELSDRLVDLLDTDRGEIYRRYADAGPRRAAEFTWLRCARETLAVYRQVAPGCG